MVNSILSQLEDNTERLKSAPASVVAQILVSLNLSGSMVKKSGKPTYLLTECSAALQNTVDALSHEELVVLSDALGKAVEAPDSPVRSLKQAIVKKLK